jgi:hypothetical protein
VRLLARPNPDGVRLCSAAAQVRYLMMALSNRSLLASWRVHAGLSAVSTVTFALDDHPPLNAVPFTHAAFHLLSAGAFLTLPQALNALVPAVAG